ncbi:MAG: GNAT family N-acetyltransferase [Acholeplasmatales bacterium]|nr:MAG: GNAT family N-acetyltransferase [Acholeplasmatales bacterium]
MIETIERLSAQDRTRIADLLGATFAAYAKRSEAEEEVASLCGKDKVLLVERRSGVIVGLIGATAQYGKTGWELHPLLVDTAHRGKGMGLRLVEALEDAVRERGGLMMYLGTDDEDNRTTLSQGDLFENLFAKVRDMRNLADHPYSFYERCGYQVVGVLPDANGWNKPDIMMAKRLFPYREDLI